MFAGDFSPSLALMSDARVKDVPLDSLVLLADAHVEDDSGRLILRAHDDGGRLPESRMYPVLAY